MIFVTVGTHEQSFDRLIREIDNLVEQKIINEDVFIQNGYSNYIPKHCKYSKMISYDKMIELTKIARINITHGGPGSIFLPIQYNKKPIVVPRDPKFNEHVDQHQIDFATRMANENRVDIVLDISELKNKILDYENYTCEIQSGSKGSFINKFNNLVDGLFKYR